MFLCIRILEVKNYLVNIYTVIFGDMSYENKKK